MKPDFYQIELIGNGFLATMARPRADEWPEEEFRDLADAGIRRIISLLEPHESYELGLQEEQGLCEAAGIAFDSFPIPDRGVPANAAEVFTLSKDTYHRCARGESTAIHCRAGIGRSSLIAAAVLLHCGFEIDEAFDWISKARGIEVPDTPEQVQWLRENVRFVLRGG